LPSLSAGNIISFNYVGPYATNPHPTSLILNPFWQGFVHAICLDYLRPLQIAHLLALANPKKEKDIRTIYIRVDRAMQTMVRRPKITEYLAFYQQVLKIPCTKYNCYRKYSQQGMSSVFHSAAQIYSAFTTRAEKIRRRLDRLASMEKEVPIADKSKFEKEKSPIPKPPLEKDKLDKIEKAAIDATKGEISVDDNDEIDFSGGEDEKDKGDEGDDVETPEEKNIIKKKRTGQASKFLDRDRSKEKRRINQQRMDVPKVIRGKVSRPSRSRKK